MHAVIVVCYQLKTPYRDGTTHVIFEPLDFIARLAALVPKPRVNLARFHGVFAPNSQHRAQITPAKRGKGNQARALDGQDATPCHVSMTWAQRLKRVFNIDIETCIQCGGAVKIIACIENSGVIKKILDRLNATTSADIPVRPESRAPPQALCSADPKTTQDAAQDVSAKAALALNAGSGQRTVVPCRHFSGSSRQGRRNAHGVVMRAGRTAGDA